MTRPQPLGDVRRHLTLLRNMAAQTGADTVLAFDEGALTQESWAKAVTTCRNCSWSGGCQKWLEQVADWPRPVPDACANATLLRDLRLPS